MIRAKDKARVIKKQRTAAPSQRDAAPVEKVVTHGEVDRKLAALDDPVEPVVSGADLEEMLAAPFLLQVPIVMLPLIEAERVRLGLRSRNEAIRAVLKVGLSVPK